MVPLATFAMVVAMLIRRAQLVSNGEEDPIPVGGSGGRMGTPSEGSQLDLSNMAEQDSQNRAMLRMVYILEKGARVFFCAPCSKAAAN